MRATHGSNLWERRRGSTAVMWGPEVVAMELGSMEGEGEPYFDPLGLVVYFESDRNGGVQELFRSDRASRDEPWTTPILIDELTATVGTSDACVSPDERYIMFTRNVAGEGREIYESRR